MGLDKFWIFQESVTVFVTSLIEQRKVFCEDDFPGKPILICIRRARFGKIESEKWCIFFVLGSLGKMSWKVETKMQYPSKYSKMRRMSVDALSSASVRTWDMNTYIFTRCNKKWNVLCSDVFFISHSPFRWFSLEQVEMIFFGGGMHYNGICVFVCICLAKSVKTSREERLPQ